MPPEEVPLNYSITLQLNKNLLKVCQEKCRSSQRQYFAAITTTTSGTCQCIKDVPLGGARAACSVK